jgi:hypothetical protein
MMVEYHAMVLVFVSVYRSVEVSHQFRSVVISHYVQVALEVYNQPVGAVLQVL